MVCIVLAELRYSSRFIRMTGNITKINDRLLLFEITHEEAMKLVGTFTLRLSIYEPDFSMVKSGEDVMSLVWEKEPVNYNLIQESCRNLNILQ